VSETTESTMSPSDARSLGVAVLAYLLLQAVRVAGLLDLSLTPVISDRLGDLLPLARALLYVLNGLLIAGIGIWAMYRFWRLAPAGAAPLFRAAFVCGTLFAVASAAQFPGDVYAGWPPALGYASWLFGVAAQVLWALGLARTGWMKTWVSRLGLVCVAAWTLAVAPSLAWTLWVQAIRDPLAQQGLGIRYALVFYALEAAFLMGIAVSLLRVQQERGTARSATETPRD
jgi:hypothetical protein